MYRGYGMFMVGLLTVIFCLVAAGMDAFVKPFVNPELGDVVLFVFALAGAGSGFAAGYGLRRARAERAARKVALATGESQGEP